MGRDPGVAARHPQCWSAGVLIGRTHPPGRSQRGDLFPDPYGFCAEDRTEDAERDGSLTLRMGALKSVKMPIQLQSRRSEPVCGTLAGQGTMVAAPWRADRVADGGGLENR
jgi:hypothetical protein